MTVNDLIKQLQSLSEDDRERVVVMEGLDVCGDDYYRLLDGMSMKWYNDELGDCPWQQSIDKGFVVIDDSYKPALVLGRVD